MGLRFKARFRVWGLGCLGSRVYVLRILEVTDVSFSVLDATLVTFAPDKIVVVALRLVTDV